MDKALIYWLYIIYPTAVGSLSAGCADTHTQRRYVPFGCSQNLIINGTLLFQLALLGQRGFHWIQKERKRLVQPTVHPQNTSCSICIHFPSFVFLSLQEKVWMSTFLERKPNSALLFAPAYRLWFTWSHQLKTSGQKQRVYFMFVGPFKWLT